VVKFGTLRGDFDQISTIQAIMGVTPPVLHRSQGGSMFSSSSMENDSVQALIWDKCFDGTRALVPSL
jgi:hypothetical protein